MHRKLVLKYHCLVVGFSCGDILIISTIVFTKPDNRTSYLDDTIRKFNLKIIQRLNCKYLTITWLMVGKKLKMPKSLPHIIPITKSRSNGIIILP